MDLVAGRMRQLRDEHNYTQEYLIDHTRLDIAHYEAGQSFPSLFSISILCKFYNITLDEFFAPMNYPSKE